MFYGGEGWDSRDILTTYILNILQANKVSTVQLSVGIIVAYMFQIFYFHHIPSTLSIIGAVLVSVAIIILTVRSFMTTANKSN